MNKIQNDKNDLTRDIREMKNGSIEQMCLITFYSLGSYFKSLFTFGSSNKVTRDSLNIIKEMFSILRTERSLLNFILKNIDSFDVNAAQDVVRMLDDVNDDTVRYYYNLIDDIEDAAEFEQEYRGYRPRNGYPTLIEDNTYSGKVIALSENLEDLKSFLGFEDDFWEFIKDKTKKVDTSVDIMDKMVYAIPICNHEGLIVSLQLMLPKVYNLESALIAIRVYKKAYEIYKLIGKKLENEIISDANQLQDVYKKEYLPRKAKDILGLKYVK